MEFKTTRRDKVVAAVANWILNTFATETYAKWLKGVYVYGLKAAAREHTMGNAMDEYRKGKDDKEVTSEA